MIDTLFARDALNLLAAAARLLRAALELRGARGKDDHPDARRGKRRPKHLRE